MCKAQNIQSQICKKVRYFTSLCKAPIPQRGKKFAFKQENRNAPQQRNQQARVVRHIQEKQQDQEQKQEEETVDTEAALYIK